MGCQPGPIYICLSPKGSQWNCKSARLIDAINKGAKQGTLDDGLYTLQFFQFASFHSLHRQSINLEASYPISLSQCLAV